MGMFGAQELKRKKHSLYFHTRTLYEAQSLSLSLSLSHAHTHTHTRARAHTRTRVSQVSKCKAFLKKGFFSAKVTAADFSCEIYFLSYGLFAAGPT